MARSLLLAKLAFLCVCCKALPNCTFTSCPICLDDSRTVLENLTLQGLDGLEYNVPLRLPGRGFQWDSVAMLSQVISILAREKLGVATEVSVTCEDEIQCFLALAGCGAWNEGRCELADSAEKAAELARSGAKARADPVPDILVALEIWPSALEPANYNGSGLIFKDRPSVEVGSTGFTVQDGMYIYRNTSANAWESVGQVLGFFPAFTKPGYGAFLDSPSKLMAGGVVPEVDGCTGDAVVQAGMDFLQSLGWVCNESWWLAPGCQALGPDWITDCFAVLDDDWGYQKPELYRAIAESGMRAAKLTIGYDPMHQLINAQTYSVAFTWWNTDPQYQNLHPVRVGFDQDLDPGQAIVAKSVYRPVLQHVQLATLLYQTMLTNKDITSMMRIVASSPVGRGDTDSSKDAFFQKLACDWLRSTDKWQAWLPNPASCGVGEYFDENSLRCRYCPTGKFSFLAKGTTVPLCVNCTVGTFASSTGQSACTVCAPGGYENRPGSSSCSVCPVSQFSTAAGSTACVACSSRHAQPERWTTMRLMEVQGKGTQWLPSDGMSDESACGCDSGSWQIGDACAVCGEGLKCGGMGKGIPLLKPGYYSKLDDPFSIYKCVMQDACPGGQPESCSEPHEGLVCAKCPTGRTRGTCNRCSQLSVFVVSASPFLLAAMILIAYRLSNAPVTVNATVTLTGNVWLGLVVTCCQVLGILNRLDVKWPAAAGSTMGVFSVLLIDFETIAPECVVGQVPSAIYSVQVMVPISILAISAMFLVFGMLAGRCLKGERRWWMLEKNRLGNTVGQVLQLLFIPFTVIATKPLQCTQHPNGSGSVLMFPEVLCFSRDHVPLLILAGLLSALFLIPFIALSVNAVRVAPSKQGSSGVNFFKRWRFMMYRFRPDVWWWGVVFLARQTCLAFATVASPDDPHLQVLYVCVTLSLYTAVVGAAWPWKNFELNVFDLTSSAGLLLVTLCTVPFLPPVPVTATHLALLFTMLAALGLAVFIMGLLVLRHLLTKGFKGEFMVLPDGEVETLALSSRWMRWVQTWSELDSDTMRGAFELMSRFDRAVLGQACKIWEGVCPDGVDAVHHMRSIRFKRCVGWSNSSAEVPMRASHNFMRHSAHSAQVSMAIFRKRTNASLAGILQDESSDQGSCPEGILEAARHADEQMEAFMPPVPPDKEGSSGTVDVWTVPMEARHAVVVNFAVKKSASTGAKAQGIRLMGPATPMKVQPHVVFGVPAAQS